MADGKDGKQPPEMLDRAEPGRQDHDCFAGGTFTYKDFRSSEILGTDNWDFSIKECRTCGRKYLRAFNETMGFSRSGWWVYGEIEETFAFSSAGEKELLSYLYGLPRLYYGGSYWGGKQAWSEKHPRAVIYHKLKSEL